MASLNALLERTLMFSANIRPKVVAPAGVFTAQPPPPGNAHAPEAEVMMTPVWTWRHDGAKPSEFRDIGSRVRGMDMDYAMVMAVCESITLDEVRLRTRQGNNVSLPVTASYALRKAYLHSGGMPDRPSGLWQLEAQLDQSLLIAFGYLVHADGSVKPLPDADIQRLGDSLMPVEGEAGRPNMFLVDRLATLQIAPLRVVLTFSLTCCKERADFEPGGVISSNRIYPHVMVTCSDEVSALSAAVTVKRPKAAAHSGPVSGQPYADHMLRDIGTIFVTDSNTPGLTFPFAPVQPIWDRMFDYYDVEPFKSGTASRPLVMVDPALNRKRVLAGGLRKITPVAPAPPATHHTVDLVKLPRQGAFDNMHIAPRMRLSPQVLVPPTLRTDDIAMAPFCVHDCLHMHFRWGLAGSAKWARGFNDNYQPYSIDGATLVPHDQKVTITCLSPSSFTYEGRVDTKIPAGRTTTFFHHGMSYANEIWDQNQVGAARGMADIMAIGRKEHMFPPPLTPTVSWALFYWRLRFGGTQNNPVERVQVPNLAAAVSL